MSHKQIVKDLQILTSAYTGDELYDQLRTFLDDNLGEGELYDILNPLLDENKDEDPEMILNILESEVDSYYRMRGMR